MAPKPSKMSAVASPGKNLCEKSSKRMKISDAKAAQMMDGFSSEQAGRHHKTEAKTVSVRVANDPNVASAVAAWIENNDQTLRLEMYFVRNARHTKTSGFKVIRGIVVRVFDFTEDGMKSLDNPACMELYKLAIGFSDNTEIPVREGDIAIFSFIVCIWIVIHPGYYELYNKIKRLRRVCFNHAVGTFVFGGMNESLEFTGIIHTMTQVFSKFPFEMRIKKAGTNDFTSKHPASCYISGNGNEASATLIRCRDGKVTGSWCVSDMFEVGLFEEAL